jgi:hypothetical protein
MEVKAVPPPKRDQMLPHKPIAIAPNADTTATCSVTYIFTTLFVAYETQEKSTMMGSWTLRTRCRLATEEQVAYRGTRKRRVHQGSSWRYQGQAGSR